MMECKFFAIRENCVGLLHPTTRRNSTPTYITGKDTYEVDTDTTQTDKIALMKDKLQHIRNTPVDPNRAIDVYLYDCDGRTVCYTTKSVEQSYSHYTDTNIREMCKLSAIEGSVSLRITGTHRNDEQLNISYRGRYKITWPNDHA